MLHVLSFKFWQDMSSSLTNRWPLSRTVWQSFLLLMPPELSVSVPGLWGHPGTLPAPVFCRWAEEWCSSVPWHQERLYLADDPRCWSWRWGTLTGSKPCFRVTVPGPGSSPSPVPRAASSSQPGNGITGSGLGTWFLHRTDKNRHFHPN